MSEIAGWLIFIGYVVVGVMRMRTYFERVHEFNQNEWPSMYTREGTNTEAFWCALGCSSIWPIWELQYWLRHFVIKKFNKVTDEDLRAVEDEIIERARDILRARWDADAAKTANQRIADGEI